MAGSQSHRKAATTPVLDFFLARENVHKRELKLSVFC